MEGDLSELIPSRPQRRYPLTRITEGFPNPGTMPRRLSLPNVADCQIVIGDEEAITQQIRAAQRMRQNSFIQAHFLYFSLAACFLTIVIILLALKLFG